MWFLSGLIDNAGCKSPINRFQTWFMVYERHPYKRFLLTLASIILSCIHDDIMTWKHFPHYWPFKGIRHRWFLHTKVLEFTAFVSLLLSWIALSPLSKPMLDYCQLDPLEQTSVNQNTKLFLHENAPENIFYEMAAILTRGRLVKSTVERYHLNVDGSHQKCTKPVFSYEVCVIILSHVLCC